MKTHTANNYFNIYKVDGGIILEHKNQFFSHQTNDWDGFINRVNLFKCLMEDLDNCQPMDSLPDQIHTPIQGQEIWAAGVTYLRSKAARMEESEKAGGDVFYDMVYDAVRPELFFKGNAYRAVGPGSEIYIRKDSTWNVPEPELTLWISSSATIEGYTIGNDMSSRSIEGENPLYLPQAKVYDKCAGLGPCIHVSEKPLPEDTEIKLIIKRNNDLVFEDSIQINRIKRKFTDLVEFLFLESSFPAGVFLMTGTGIVPDQNFTLQENDEVSIQIDPIGTLKNIVKKK